MRKVLLFEMLLLCFLSGKKLGYTFDNKNFHNVSLGQGQEVVAEQALSLAAENGHWVILQVQYKHAHVDILHEHRQTYLAVVLNIMHKKYYVFSVY